MTNFDFLLSEPQFGGLRGELSPGDGVCRKMDVLGGFGAGQTL